MFLNHITMIFYFAKSNYQSREFVAAPLRVSRKLQILHGPFGPVLSLSDRIIV